ncbi:cuscuta receptor 1-like [Nicotiana tabacum]|uniref:Cuscuta receptor 1-like n=1 Tax=Nicotiana tabacum TaxID=4097 RepID=A0AC58U0K9_TOBAC
MEISTLLWFWGIVLVGLVYGNSACLEEERIALLHIKATFKSTHYSTWVDNKKSDCCIWEGVKCSNSTTMPVIELSVNGTDPKPNTRYFNASMFLPFQSLVVLNLPNSYLVGWFKNEGFDKLSELRNLKVLDLSGNKFNLSVLSSLSQLSSLKSLILSGNPLDSVPTKPSFEKLTNLSNLEVLDLGSTLTNHSDLQSILNLNDFTRLKYLDISGNHLHTFGSFDYDWCHFKNLQELRVGSNNFDGMLPSCLANLTFLLSLDISNNRFTGNIASSPLSKLTSLVSLNILNNNLEVPVSFEAFANHSSLIEVYTDGNIGVPETESRAWVPMFQLEIFSMSNCTHLQTLPRFLHYQNRLTFLDFSLNHLRGSFPNWLFQNNTQLIGLSLGGNAFIGSFSLPLLAQPSVKYIGISENRLSGQLQANISSVFPNLVLLKMSGNCLEGQIPASVWQMKGLEALDLANNHFSGELPTEVVIPPSLQYLHLNGNNFTGEIPKSLSSTNLAVLEISNNSLSGMIPEWMGQMSGLVLLAMSHNHLRGPIPVELCNLDRLRFLDLSENQFSGLIPSCFSHLEHLFLNKNHLSGNLTHGSTNNSALLTLDLSDNNIVGSIPQWIGNLSVLNILLLKNNKFEGDIPNHLCHLQRLRMLDLSHNQLTESIPSCLSNISQEVNSQQTFRLPALESFAFQSVAFTSVYTMFDAVRMKVEFTTKSSSLNYEGGPLLYMSGIDLSSNRLSGEVPIELGNLSEIQVLNFSHNNLVGSIPKTFSNLHEIGCIDLSYNKLSGRIPHELLELHSLAVFSVAHNNLSGSVPELKGQFSTFDETSYEGNPFLCGPPLHINCTNAQLKHPIQSNDGNEEEGEDGFIDMEIFYISFSVAFPVFFIGVITTLCVNSSWRYRWFHFVENLVFSCYYFLVDRVTNICSKVTS